MNEAIKTRLNAILDLLKSQLTEASTVRGVLVLLTMGTGWAAKIPVDTVVPIAVVVGAVLKIILPDKIK